MHFRIESLQFIDCVTVGSRFSLGIVISAFHHGSVTVVGSRAVRRHYTMVDGSNLVKEQLPGGFFSTKWVVIWAIAEKYVR